MPDALPRSRALTSARAVEHGLARGPVRAAGAIAALLLAVLLAVLLGVVAAPRATAADDVPPQEPEPLVLVGVGGLHWSDIDRTGTPTLWRMVGEGSVGSIALHTVDPQTCPLDAWATISAGRRVPVLDASGTDGAEGTDGTDGTAEDGTQDDEADTGCRELPSVDLSDPSGGLPGPAVVQGWSTIVDPAAPPGSYGTLGTVGDRIADVDVCTTAIGRGGGVALADASGSLDSYAPALGLVGNPALTACPVTVLDAGDLPADRARRQSALELLDDGLRRIQQAVEPGTRLVVAGVSDSPSVESGLQAVVQWDGTGGAATWLTSESTRRTGIVTLADLSATIVDAAGAQTDDLDGSPLEVGAERRMSTDRTVENRRYLTELTTIAPHLLPVTLGTVVAGVVVVLAALLVARRRGRHPAPAVRRVSIAVLLLATCTPVGAHLAALARWWVSPAPLFAATASYAVATGLVALAAWTLSRLLPRGPWRLATATAGLTWLVLTVDGLTGTVLQQGSILGASPTLGARYYGFGNTTFGVYAAAALLLAGSFAVQAAAQGARRAGLVVASVIGVVTVVVDGWPAFGADFGGVLALVPAFAVLLLGLAGAQARPRRLALVGALAVAVVAAVAVIDWARPGRPTHLGLFVQRVLDGDAVDVVAGKAANAWATVAVPLGAVAAVLCLVVCAVLVGPDRWRPPALRRAYATWPGLRVVLLAVVVAAVVGSLVNDSGVVVAVAVLGVAGGALLASRLASGWEGLAVEPDAARPHLRSMPATIVATTGGLLLALLLATVLVPLPAATAGDVSRGDGAAALPQDAPVVVVGTSAVAWRDVDREVTPTLWGLLRDGAAAGGVTPGVTGRNGWCPSGGWLAISSGRPVVTGERDGDEWVCAPWSVAAGDAGEGSADDAAGGATVTGWDELRALQSASEFNPRLGVLGDTLAEASTCTTAVGDGAALALAATDGSVPRYRTLYAALADPDDAFACGITLVDAGSAVVDTELLDEAQAEAAEAAALRAVDANVRRVLQAVPSASTVMVVDTGNAAPGRSALGVGIAEDQGPSAGFLTTPATRWEGVFRLLDLPTTLVTWAGLPVPDDFTGSPVTIGDDRPADVGKTVRQLADLTARDQALRGVSAPVTNVPLLVSLGVLALAGLLGPRIARSRPRRAAWLARAADATLVVLGAVPVALFLMTTTAWWRFGSPRAGMWVSLALTTALVAGVVALVPRRPATTGVGVLAALTFGVLTLDALLGTPLHRGSPLGPAPTLGGRYYGFGNPTYSVYVVAAFVTAAVVGSWLVRRGHRWLGALAAAAVCGLALVVDLWPGLGADVGGGLVLLPTSAVVVLAVAGIRITWQRLAVAGLAGVVVVGAIAFLDWTRPAASRTHLGTFVQGVIDGTAWETVTRKLGYAAESLSSGWMSVLTLVLLAACLVLLWPRSRWRVAAWDRLLAAWPVARPLVAALLLAAVAGGLVNDYGVRIATSMIAAALPLLGLLLLRTSDLPDPHYPASTRT